MALSETRNNRRSNTQDAPPWQHVRLADTDRLESFSDGVFAITITLLVAEIVRPEYEPGHLLEKLLAQWPNYVAFLASFFYIGIIWLNHRAVFARVRYCDRSLHLANLFCLLASALIPFPTAVLSTALQHANPFDATVAVAFYAAIGGVMCLAWLLLFHVLSIHSYLLENHVDPTFFPKERHRAVLGVALYAAAGVIGWAYAPKLALMIFLALPIFDGITSEGLTETRVRILHRRARQSREATRFRTRCEQQTVRSDGQTPRSSVFDSDQRHSPGRHSVSSPRSPAESRRSADGRVIIPTPTPGRFWVLVIRDQVALSSRSGHVRYALKVGCVDPRALARA